MLPLRTGRRSALAAVDDPRAAAWAVEDLHVTAQGLWVGGETTHVGGEVRAVPC
jgi:hypothetical protein